MSIRSRLPLLLALLLVASAALAPPPVQAATTFTVNSTADPGDGVCDATQCTLREAITAANATPGLDTIAFNIPGSGPHTIQPASALPTITDPVTIDGYTQPGASPNTNGPGLGSNAVLKIELDGTSAGSFVNGLTVKAGDSAVSGLVINRFSASGIYMQDKGVNRIIGNFIGTDLNGTADFGNGQDGVGIGFASNNNVIGGTQAAARNVISGNGSNGIDIFGFLATNNVVQGNFIGTDVTGTKPLGNTRGIWVSTEANTIGGIQTAARNVISGNGLTGTPFGSGIRINGTEATGNNVQGNFIGTDVTGASTLGNARDGVFISNAPSNIIGGAVSGARNVISGNSLRGVEIAGSGASGNLVQGNFIGTDVTGTADVGNFLEGILIHSGSRDNVIGGTASVARNVISGNGSGVVFLSGSTGNVVQGNFIGTDVTGTAALGNTFDGVSINASSNSTVGGTTAGAGNVIAFNGEEGVQVFPSIGTATGNAILSNSIFSNTRLGIDLSPIGVPSGVTPNDSGDADTGPNNLQNFPALSLAVSSSGGITIAGILNSAPSTAFRVELFANAACDPSGFGEGQTFLGFTTVTTNPSGNATFSAIFVPSVAVGKLITATATDPNGNTSEFSQCLAVIASPVPTPVPGVSGPALAALAGLLVAVTIWTAWRRKRQLEALRG